MESDKAEVMGSAWPAAGRGPRWREQMVPEHAALSRAWTLLSSPQVHGLPDVPWHWSQGPLLVTVLRGTCEAGAGGPLSLSPRCFPIRWGVGLLGFTEWSPLHLGWCARACQRPSASLDDCGSL